MTPGVLTAWAALAGLISLDATYVGQFMISRPIVVGPLFGWLCGDPLLGLAPGILLELVWISPIPMKGRFLPDLTLAAAFPVIWMGFFLSGGERGSLSVTLGYPLFIVVGVLAASISKWVEMRVRKATASLSAGAVRKVQAGDISAVPRAFRIALLAHAARAILIAVLLAWIGAGFLNLLPQAIPETFQSLPGPVIPISMVKGGILAGLGLALAYLRRV